MDAEKSRLDSENKARRSSILKPQKPRNPFSTLDFAEPNPDNTLARAARRVSFASSNFVKPFAADAEKNTIWDNTYEEEVNHTDSTKSSYEQTLEAKSADLLNLTSIHSPTSDNEFFKYLPSPQIIYPEGAIGTSKSFSLNKNKEKSKTNVEDDHIANTMNSVISFVKICSNKPALETCSRNKTIFMEESVKMTICVNKENVNPIINDISLVAPVDSNLRRSSRLKDKSSNATGDQEKSKENVSVPTNINPEETHSQNCLDPSIVLNQCDMELTEPLSVMDIKETEQTVSKTVYFLEDDMELTKPLEVRAKTELHCEEPKNNKKRSTIHFNRSDNDMEFTCTLPSSVGNKTPILANTENIVTENSIRTKQETSNFNRTEGKMEFSKISKCVDQDMEYTSLSLKNIKASNEGNNRDSKRRTIYFDQSDGDMEFTVTLPVIANNINTHVQAEDKEFNSNLFNDNVTKVTNAPVRKRETIHFNQSEADMEFTAPLPVGGILEVKEKCGIDSNRNSTFDQSERNIKFADIKHTQSIEQEDMQFMTPFPDKIDIAEKPTDSKGETILYAQSNDDMELTTTYSQLLLTKKEQINEKSNLTQKFMKFNKSEVDMEFTTNLSMWNDITEKSVDPKRATILYTQFNNDMELTSILPTKKEQINDMDSILTQKITKFNNSEIDMKFTTNLSRRSGIFKDQTEKENNCATKMAVIKIDPELNVSEKEMKIMDTSGNVDPLSKTETNNKFMVSMPVINNSNNDNKRHSNSGNDDDVIKKIKIDDLSLNECRINKSSDENNDAGKAFLVCKNTEKYAEDNAPSIVVMESDIESDNNEKTCLVRKSTKKLLEDSLPVEENKIHIKTDANQIHSDIDVGQKVNLQSSTVSSSNILYAEPKKINLKTRNFIPIPDLSANSNLQTLEGSLNLNLVPVSTPATSFHCMNITNMSPCIEDTQQLIHATFSRPESLKKLLLGKITESPRAHSNDILQDKTENITSDIEDIVKPVHKTVDEPRENEKTFTSDQCRGIKNTYDIEKSLTEKSLILEKFEHKTVDESYKNNEKTLTSDQCRGIENTYVVKKPLKETSLILETFEHKTVDDSYKGNEKTLTSDQCGGIENTYVVEKPLKETNLMPEKSVHKTVNESYKVNEKTFTSDQCKRTENTYVVEKPLKERQLMSEKSVHKTVNESYKGNEKTFTSDQCRRIENTYVVEKPLKETSLRSEGFPEKRDSYDCEETNAEHYFSGSANPKTEKSWYMEDTSIVALVPTDLDESSLVSDTLNLVINEDVKLVPGHKPNEQNESLHDSSCSAGVSHNYTLRSQSILANIEKHLISYTFDRSHDYSKMRSQLRQNRDDDLMIKDLFKNLRIPKIPVVDFEEKHKQDLKDSSSRVCKAVMSTQDKKEAPSMAGLTAPKSLHDRICETAERCKKQWKFIKVKDDWFHFRTLFEKLPFKVHVHPALGTVYLIETRSALAAVAKPICHYELNLFRQKLKLENLLSVLGAQFDILTLLDYVCMTMEEIANFHTEYNNLVKEYGKTHHFRMDSNFSVIFEIINLELIICWKISIKISPTTSISKDDVTATAFRVGEKVDEEHIKCIAENTPKGLNFFRNFIKNVDEYVQRIGKKIKFRRGNRF